MASFTLMALDTVATYLTRGWSCFWGLSLRRQVVSLAPVLIGRSLFVLFLAVTMLTAALIGAARGSVARSIAGWP